jgi:hypothetical protein
MGRAVSVLCVHKLLLTFCCNPVLRVRMYSRFNSIPFLAELSQTHSRRPHSRPSARVTCRRLLVRHGAHFDGQGAVA